MGVGRRLEKRRRTVEDYWGMKSGVGGNMGEVVKGRRGWG